MDENNKPEWNEFTDQELANWKRIRLAIEHENTLTNARVNWLLLTQGFLFASFMAIYSALIKEPKHPDIFPPPEPVLAVIAFAGFLSSWFLSGGIRAAFEQHNHLVKWWKKYLLATGAEKNKHPNICGHEPEFGPITIPYHQFPGVFALIWTPLILLSLQKYFTDNKDQIAYYIVGAIGAILSIALGMWIRQKLDSIKRDRDGE